MVSSSLFFAPEKSPLISRSMQILEKQIVRTDILEEHLWEARQKIEKLELEQIKISSTTKELSDEVFFYY